MSLTVYQRSSRSSIALTELLQQGAVVAAPTETAYGLLAAATNRQAVATVVALKGRRTYQPLALVAADFAMVRRYWRLTGCELRLAKAFWPGALTLLLKPRYAFPPALKGRDGRVGVRVPGNAWLRELIKAVGVPLTSTSANRTGAATPYTAAAVERQLKRRGLRYLVNGGRLKPRATSTIVRVVHRGFTVVRAGAVPPVRLKRVLL